MQRVRMPRTTDSVPLIESKIERAVGIQMKKRPLQLDLLVGGNDAVATAITLAERLMAQEGIALGRVGVGLAPSQVPDGVVRLVMTQQQEQNHGAP